MYFDFAQFVKHPVKSSIHEIGIPRTVYSLRKHRKVRQKREDAK